MNYRNIWICAPVALFATVAVLSHLEAARRQSAEDRFAGHLTRQEALHRLEAFRQNSVLPAFSNPSLYQVSTHSRDARVRRFWLVDYRDEKGRYGGHVQWDADSGQLYALSRRPSEGRFVLPDLTDKEALSCAFQLVKQPGLSLPGEQWILTTPPKESNGQWHFYLKSAARLAYLNIDARTGQICYLRYFDLAHSPRHRTP